jgi:tetratricopeptide (TPR) repeat protein
VATEQGYEPGEIYARMGLGLVARRAGRYNEAEEHLRSVLDWNQMVSFEPGNILVLAELGFIAEQRGNAKDAEALHRQALTLAQKVGDPRATALAQEGLAGALSLAGHHKQATLLLGTAAATRESAGAPLPSAEQTDVNRITARTKTALGTPLFTTLFNQGHEQNPTAPTT